MINKQATEPGTLRSDAGETPDDLGIATEPLWRIRLRLLAKASVANWRLFFQSWTGRIGLVIIGIFALAALAHPVLMSTIWEPRIYDPVTGHDAPTRQLVVVEEVTDPRTQIELQRARLSGNFDAEVGDVVTQLLQPAPPSRTHLLGTDPLGRDVASQLMFSTRAAFGLGALAALVTVVIATTVGSVAAYFGGVTDTVLMRFADLMLLIPLLPLLIVISGLFTLQLVHLGVVLGLLTGFGGTAIVLKSAALAVKVKPFIDAARVAGGGHAHIIFRHIVPNVLPLSLLYMMFTVTGAITAEAVLSFFGLLNVPMSWGIMLNTTQVTGYILRGIDYWWLVIPPGLAVSLLATAFFLVSRAMDEVVNPRLRSR
jgi:peptide/nickel transport system permease protein